MYNIIPEPHTPGSSTSLSFIGEGENLTINIHSFNIVYRRLCEHFKVNDCMSCINSKDDVCSECKLNYKGITVCNLCNKEKIYTMNMGCCSYKLCMSCIKDAKKCPICTDVYLN